MEVNKIYEGNALLGLKTLSDGCVDCCVTSPPYWGLRSYKTNPQIWDAVDGCEHNWVSETKKGITGGIKSKMVKRHGVDNFQIVPDSEYCFCSKCGAWKGELGSEPTFQLFIKHLVAIFTEVKRVLKDTGTCFVNLGDTYGGSVAGTTKFADTTKYIEHSKQVYVLQNGMANTSQFRNTNLNKSILMIPARFGISMVDDAGWICRNEIIWQKPNQMPSSATDRFTVDFEKIFFCVKQSTGYYFKQQFEPYTEPLDRWAGQMIRGDYNTKTDQFAIQERNGRDMRPNPEGKNMRTVWGINTDPFPEAHFATYPEELVARMLKSGCPEGGVVLDPFMGAGTTGLVARKLGRNYIGFELNPEYIKIAEKRIFNEIGLFV